MLSSPARSWRARAGTRRLDPRRSRCCSVPIMIGAIFAVHVAAGFFFSNPGGGWEYPAFWTVA